MADIRKAALDMGDVREFPLGKKRKNKITLHNKTKTKPGNNTCCTTQQHLVTWEHGPGKIILEKCAIQQKFAIYLALHMFSCLKRHVPNFQIAGEYNEIRVGLLKDSLSLSLLWISGQKGSFHRQKSEDVLKKNVSRTIKIIPMKIKSIFTL